MQNEITKESTFPVWVLLPKKETGVTNLLSKYSSYDGRGTVIAVFDSGIDPFAPGLQVTTDGKRKIIDRIDASGAGDVDTSTVVEAKDGVIKGLSGKNLHIPNNWVNPTGTYHIGVKSAYGLYPSKLKDRIVSEKKEKLWDPEHKQALASAQKIVQIFETQLKLIQTIEANGCTPPPCFHGGADIGTNGSAKDSEDGSVSPDDSKKPVDVKEAFSVPTLPAGGNDCCATFDRLQKEDNEATVSILKQLEKKFNDSGPSYDCVVYHDGTDWKVCIDTSECGNLNQGLYLGEYRVDSSCKYLTDRDQYTVSVNVHNDGNLLEIVGMCSAHGTHVASIAAANFPDEPDKNGVAPGAQIVSIQIGDNRLGSMETGTAIVRALSRVMENPHYKVDVINMSYGEQGHWCHGGRIGELVNEVVNRYGVIYVGSAGNHGPGLSTIGVPPDFATDSVIGVGAYVSPDMMAIDHNLVEKMPGCSYTWTSRGPTFDGGRGVSVCAPGGAITSVPNFTLKKNSLMNGTSMASPHTAGCVALLVSAMKQKEIAYSPYSIRRALQNTALDLHGDPFAQGHGLVQVHKTLDYLLDVRTDTHAMEHKVQILVDCGGREKRKGVYLRNWAANRVVEGTVTIEPAFLNDSEEPPKDKLDFNMEFFLTCDAPFVKHPSHIQCSYVAKSFKVFIDPCGLKPGHSYFTRIQGFSSTNPDKGPFFEVPITVIIPQKLTNGNTYSKPVEHYPSAMMRRTFLEVPSEATYAVIKVKTTECPGDKAQRFILHTVQLKPASSVTTLEYYKTLILSPNDTNTQVFCVRGNLTLEVCIARLWSCVANGFLGWDIFFHSVSPLSGIISFASCESFHRIDVRVGLVTEDVLPNAIVKQVSQSIVPHESKIEVLNGERDTLPRGRPIYQLVLTYAFSVGRANVEVTPKAALLCDVLYESSFESQLWIVFDSNKQMLGAGDAFYKNYSLKLDKGDYVLKLHVRHDKMEHLEKLVDMPVTVYFKLPSELKLDVYTSFNNALTQGRKAAGMYMSPGASQHYYIMPPNITDKMFKSHNITPGHTLHGTVSFTRDDLVRKADFYDLKIFVTEIPNKKKNSSTDEKKDSKTRQEFEEGLRDYKAAHLIKLDKTTRQIVYDEIKDFDTENTDYKQTAAAHMMLQAMDNDREEIRENIIGFATQLIESIDQNALLKYFGLKTDSRAEAIKHKNSMDKLKSILIDAYNRCGANIVNDLVEKNIPISNNLQPIDEIARQIVQYTDVTDSKVINFFFKYYSYRNYWGLACRLAQRQLEEKTNKINEERLIKCFSKLKLDHVVKHFESQQSTKYPPNYNPF